MTLLSVWSFLKKVPGWVWFVVIGALVGFTHLQNEKARVRREVNAKRDKEAAEVEREVVSNIQENTDEVVREADAVREHPSAVVMPDGTATLEKYHYRD